MRYFANPSTQKVREAMTAGLLDCIDTPAQGNTRPPRATWCADNGCFSDRWDAAKWWTFLAANAQHAGTCAFAVAPDVVGDAWATHVRAMPWLKRIRDLGYPVAYVAQDGARADRLPWGHFDALFIGGSTEWKLGTAARALAHEAKARGLWVHMGRVNSERRMRYASSIGCDSVDGTYITFGPDQKLPDILAWLRGVNEQPNLFGIPA